MNKFRLLIITITALVTAACSSDDTNDIQADTIELRLSSSISSGTTRAYTPTQSTALTVGQTVYAWVDDAGDATHPASEHVKAWTLLCGTGGTLTGTKQYFPASGRTVNVYALHGNFATVPVENTTSWTDILGATHNVETDQTVAGNYEKSDLLYARNTSITRDNSVKPLNFAHQLAKIELNLIAGTGLVKADVQGSTVRLLNTQPSATITPAKSGDPDAVIAAAGTAAPIQCRMQTADDVQVDVSDTPGVPNMQYAYAFAEAIIVPQTLAATTEFIEITLPAGIVLKTQIAAGGITFDKGKKYVYNVTVNSSELTLNCNITDWTDSGAPINTSAD